MNSQPITDASHLRTHAGAKPTVTLEDSPSHGHRRDIPEPLGVLPIPTRIGAVRMGRLLACLVFVTSAGVAG